MMNNIISPGFSQDIIDKENYTLSLLQRCYLDGYISLYEQDQIKKTFNQEFAEIAGEYTKRESSTISKKNCRADLFFNTFSK